MDEVKYTKNNRPPQLYSEGNDRRTRQSRSAGAGKFRTSAPSATQLPCNMPCGVLLRMGFHCGNTASGKLAFCEMKYQMIMARSLPIEVTQGTLEGDIKPGDITFYRLQSTSDNVLRAYVAQGEVLPVATKSFGSIGVFAIPEMGRFYRHVLIEKNYPHHGAVAFGHFGKALFEVFKYIGVPVEEIGYNQPAGVRYPTENPWG